MTGFFEALFQHRFLQLAILAGLLSSLAAGVIGTYVVNRRISYLGGGIAHAVLGGLGLAYYLRVARGMEFVHPLYGAAVAAVLVAVVIGLISLRARQREDTVISALWAVGMALGLIFIARTPGYNTDLMSYLFGNILMVSTVEIKLLVFLDIVVIGVALAFNRQLVAVCFDEEFARVRGVNVELYYLMLLVLTALTVVIMVTVVGVVMVIALLTLPAAVAGFFTRRVNTMIVLASALALAFTIIGLIASFYPDLPAGATIILVAGLSYIVMAAVQSIRGRLS